MYKMMTATEVVEELFKKNKPCNLAFTFDDLDKDPECEPSGWYGVGLVQIFDEEDFVFAMGYYGGGSTETYDIYGMVDNSDDEEYVQEYCIKRLQNFMDAWCDRPGFCDRICVEIKEGENDDI